MQVALGHQSVIWFHVWGKDLVTVVYFNRVSTAYLITSHHSLYEEIKSSPTAISVTTRNLFLALAETIVRL